MNKSEDVFYLVGVGLPVGFLVVGEGVSVCGDVEFGLGLEGDDDWEVI